MPRLKLRSLLLVFAGGLLLPPAARAQPGQQLHALTVEDLWKVKRVQRPQLSPDGKWVLVEATDYSMETNESETALWLLATENAQQRELVAAALKPGNACWAPDSTRIAFTSKEKDKTAQIFLLEIAGGKPKQLTKMPMAPAALRWSRDGNTICCIARVWPETPDDDSYKQKDELLKKDKSKAVIIDAALYRYWDTWYADGKQAMLFAVDAQTGKHRNLMAKSNRYLPLYSADLTSYDIAPDGKELCFVSESVKEIGTDFNYDLYTLPLEAAGEVKNLTTDNQAGDTTPVYSPDGKSIAFLRQTIKYFYADRSRLMIHDRAAGKNRELTAKLDRSCHNPRWLPDAQTICFEAEDSGYERIYEISTSGGEAKPFTEKHADNALHLSADGKRLVFLRSSLWGPARVMTMRRGEAKVVALDTFNEELTAGWNLGKVDNVTFKGADDADVQMWVVYPPEFDASKKWPLLQVVHGGPHNGITNSFHFRWNLQLFAAQGYVVACVNFHGSSGFGQKFTDSITGDLGTKPMIDILKATDYLEARPFIDRNRTTAAGASYGGFMMAWLNGHTDRFKAMVCHAGVYNWHSMMASDVVRSRERPLGTLPWGDLSKIDKQSPQRLAANFKTPTLVLHGEKDYRVPITQGFEYYNTLRLKGVPTRLVYFPDENHWVLKPQNARIWTREVFAWLDRYVGKGPTK